MTAVPGTKDKNRNQLLKRIHSNKRKLLLVLQRPGIPLQTHGSETDIRDYVKKRKVSGGTRSDEGRRCCDTFVSLKKTSRKLDISPSGTFCMIDCAPRSLPFLRCQIGCVLVPLSRLIEKLPSQCHSA